MNQGLTTSLSYYSSPTDGKDRRLAQEILDFVSVTDLYEKLIIIVTDETALMVGKFNGVIRSLEELL